MPYRSAAASASSPSRSRSASAPAGVSRTARPLPTRRTHDRSSSSAHRRGAAPPPPPPPPPRPRAGGAPRHARQMLPSLGPVQAAAGRRAAARAQCGGVGAQGVGEPRTARAGEREATVLVEQAAFGHRVGEGHAQAPGQVVVTRTPAGQRGRGVDGAQPARRGGGRVEVRGEDFEQFGDAGARQLHVPVAALAPLHQQPALGQPRQVLARAGRRHPRVRGQLARRPSPPVQQGQAEGGPGTVREQAREARQPGAVGRARVRWRR